ncbi:unnamed protein product [Linum tenue]|uniref:HMA domain-containing protein n=1 Tax=Linum tenue TaxID=586396 RepID=A0AAV0S1P8_9ROSI|nr:unnamed protein product [Linum tenue]
MAPELERARVTEIQVRVDCNGCVQKIKKALHGVNGIYELYIDVPQQKLTIVGWADPQKIVKAIRKTRKTAIICSHSEPPSDPQEQPLDGGESPQPPDESNQSDPPPPEPEGPPQQTEPPKEPSPPPQPPENQQPEEKQSPPPPPEPEPEPEPNSSSQQPPQPAGGQKDVGEVHVIYHHPPSDYHRYPPPPPDYGYRYNGYGGGGSPSSSGSTSGYHHWDRYPDGPGYPPVVTRPPPPHQPPPPPVYVAHHNYSTYRPTPYVTEYEYVRSTQPAPPSPPPQSRYMPPPQPQPSRYADYGRMDYYNEEYHDYNHRGNGNVSSMFSDENPNACTVM